MNTALDKFRADASDPALFGDETQYTTGVGMTRVENALNKAQALIDIEQADLYVNAIEIQNKEHDMHNSSYHQ